MSKQARSTSLEYHDAEGNTTLFGFFKFDDEEDLHVSAVKEGSIPALAVNVKEEEDPRSTREARVMRVGVRVGRNRLGQERMLDLDTEKSVEWNEAIREEKSLGKGKMMVNMAKGEGDGKAEKSVDALKTLDVLKPSKMPKIKAGSKCGGALRKKVKLSDDAKMKKKKAKKSGVEGNEQKKVEVDSLEVETGKGDKRENTGDTVTSKRKLDSENLEVKPGKESILDDDESDFEIEIEVEREREGNAKPARRYKLRMTTKDRGGFGRKRLALRSPSAGQ